MPYRTTPFINQNFYHIFNRGVNKQTIFSTNSDYDRFIKTLFYYQFSGPNTKHGRSGPLFQGEFKAVPIETDEQLLHVSRYIHLNPLVSDIVADLKNFPHSSYQDFVALRNTNICTKEPILNFFQTSGDYQKFIEDHQEYAHSLEKIKHLLIEDV